jgi:hypothetical protein
MVSSRHQNFVHLDWQLATGNWKLLLPTALRHPGDVPLECQLAEAETAQRELPHVGARAAAPLAPVAEPDLELRGLCFFRDLRSGCHVY